MIAIDTNVLYYSIDANDRKKQNQSLALLRNLAQTNAVVIPWQVACEFLGLLRERQQRGLLPGNEVEKHLQGLLAIFPMVLPTRLVLQASLLLTQRFSLSHWDRLLVAACLEAQVTKLYSKDMQDGFDYDGVCVENPFR